MPDPVLNALPLDPAMYERIGRIASEWAYIEMLLGEALAHFCDADPGSMYVITQNVSAATVTDWLRTLVSIRVHDASWQQVILKLLKEVDAAREDRNIIVHGVWRGHETPGFGWVRTMRWERQEVTRDELWSLADIDYSIAHQESLQLGLANLGIKFGFLKLDPQGETPAAE
jgi:hypothetical protein